MWPLNLIIIAITLHTIAFVNRIIVLSLLYCKSQSSPVLAVVGFYNNSQCPRWSRVEPVEQYAGARISRRLQGILECELVIVAGRCVCVNSCVHMCVREHLSALLWVSPASMSLSWQRIRAGQTCTRLQKMNQYAWRRMWCHKSPPINYALACFYVHSSL